MERAYFKLAACLTAVGITALIAASALAGPAVQQMATGGQTAEQRSPALSGLTAVWTDTRTGDQDIYEMNVQTGAVSPVLTHSANQNNPKIDGNRVVWTDYRQDTANLTGQNIYSKDLLTGEIIRVNKATYLTPDYPAVSGNRVFWQARDTATPTFTHIYYRDLTPGAPNEAMIGGYLIDQVQPVASGQRVAWTDIATTGAKHVEVYDFNTSTAALVTDAAGSQLNPALDGDIVAWEDTRGGNSDIYLKNLATGIEEPVATGTANQHNPAVSGNLLAWLEDGNTIKMKNLTSGIVMTLVSDNSGKSALKLDRSGWLIWEDDRNGNPDLFGLNLSPGRPGLRLAMGQAYWDSYQDYQSRLLSVDYRVTNASPLGSYGVQITKVTNTGGVTTETPLPQLIGDIPSSSARNFTLKFTVSAEKSQFSSALTATCRDAAANIYQYPGGP